MDYCAADDKNDCLECGMPIPEQNKCRSRLYCDLDCRKKANHKRKHKAVTAKELLQIKNSEGELIEI